MRGDQEAYEESKDMEPSLQPVYFSRVEAASWTTNSTGNSGFQINAQVVLSPKAQCSEDLGKSSVGLTPYNT